MSVLLMAVALLIQSEPDKAAKAEPTEGERILLKVERAMNSSVAVRFSVNTENKSYRWFDNCGAEMRQRVTHAKIDLRPGDCLTIDGLFPTVELKWPGAPEIDCAWMVLESNGRTFKVTPYGQPAAARAETPKNLNQDLLRDFLYLGVRLAIVERLKSLAPLKGQTQDPNPDLMRDSTVTFLGKDTLDEVDALKLEIKPRKAAGPATPVTLLWIDPKTHLPLRRETRTKGANWEKTDVERYSDFGTDPFN